MIVAMVKNISLPQAALLATAVALAGILSALAFQHLGGYVPCALCYMQRYAYYAGVPLAAGSFLLARSGQSGIAALLLALCGLGFAINAGIGVYHSGVEWKWWEGPTSCGGGDFSAVGGNLLEALEGAKAVSCSEAPWRLLGLSFAGWNVVISAGIALVAFLGVRRRRAA
jgi:disulfide bond formation protein DsbB